MNQLTTAVQGALESAGLWKDGTALLIGVSGGCDSVALLHAACRLRAQKNLLVHAVHVQHGLRGADSLEDERFVRALCESLHVPLTVENAGLTGDMHTPGMEALARDSRRRIFANLLSSLNADALLTAHHRDDQAETVLMHLLRGSGLTGLCGMSESVPFGNALLIRPFLGLPKAQLRAALEAENLPCREDGSNQEAITPRNVLRLDVLPQLNGLFPGADEHIARLAETISADEAFLCAEADALYERSRYAKPPLFMLRLKPLAQAHEAIRRRVLRRWYLDGVQAAGLTAGERSLCFEDSRALSALIFQPEGSVLNLPHGLMACREREWLHMVFQIGQPLCPAAPFCTAVSPMRPVYDLPNLTLRAALPSYPPRDALSVVLTPELLMRQPVWRTPQPEDVIRPFGAPGHKPLRRYFTDRKTDRFLRTAWPVLAISNEVLWLPGLCASELTRVDPLPEQGIQLTVTGETPFNLPKE